MTLKEFKDKLNTIPKDFDDYKVGGLFDDYEVEDAFDDVDISIYMNLKQVTLLIKR